MEDLCRAAREKTTLSEAFNVVSIRREGLSQVSAVQLTVLLAASSAKEGGGGRGGRSGQRA